MDVYGFCILPKDYIFPHLRGEIPGFSTPGPRFEQWQKHHVYDPGPQKEYDLTVYSIVKYFRLCLDNNPNLIDSLFTPRFAVLHSTQVSEMVRENRQLFLHKGAWSTFKGYAYSQLHKMSSKEPIGKRIEMVEQHGYDVKFAYHTVRLLDEIEQILTTGDIDLQRNREQLKAIRRGEWTEEEVRQWASDKERQLEELYAKSELRPTPDEEAVKSLLLACLETHYGTLEGAIREPDAAERALEEIEQVLTRYRRVREMDPD